MTLLSISDLHCDLLTYLMFSSSRTPWDLQSRCSIPQLKAGGVGFQALAVYADTKKGSTKEGEKQFAIFSDLKEKESFGTIEMMAAVENASAICEEDEPLSMAFSRLERYHERAGPFLYLSLTWNDENRFGGGAHSGMGLKEDGIALLEWLAEKRVVIDFSHASDRLAYDILNVIDQRGLPLVPIASHSNFRSVTSHPRNLPDDLAREIFARGGIIGLNLITFFVGESCYRDFNHHIEYAKDLGGLKQLALGADFFCVEDFPKYKEEPFPFFEETADASCYPKLFNFLQTTWDRDILEGLAHKNFSDFMERRKCC